MDKLLVAHPASHQFAPYEVLGLALPGFVGILRFGPIHPLPLDQYRTDGESYTGLSKSSKTVISIS